MALSGYVNTTDYDGRYYKLAWTATQSVANNQSTINWTLSAETAGWWAERTLNVVIAGTTVYTKTDRVERYDGTIATGSLKLTHDSAGNKSFSVSVQAAVYGSSVNCTGSKTFTLNQIPRAATLTKAVDFTDEGSPTINYSNPAGTSVDKLQACISFTGAKDDIPYRDLSKTDTSYKFTFTDAEKQTFYNSITTGSSREVIFYVKTVIGSNTYFSTIKKTLTLVNHTPTTNGTAADTQYIALTGDGSKIIKGYNTVEYAVNAAGRKGATVAANSQGCYVGSTKYTGATGTLTNITTGTIDYWATDSRGNGVDYNVSTYLTVIDYINLTCNVDATITLDTESTSIATLNISGNYWDGNFGAQNNALTLNFRYSIGNGEMGSWQPLTATINNDSTYAASTTVSDIPYQEAFNVEIQAIDKLLTLPAVTRTLKTVPVFDWSGEDFAFNVPVTIQGSPLVDYIIERGTDSMGSNGTWYWEKWASGKAVCYGRRNYGNMAVTTAWGNMYESSGFTQDFPSGLFIEAPTHMDIHTIQSGACLITGFGYTPAPTKDNTGMFFFFRPIANTVSQVHVAFNIIGKWR